MKDDTHWADMIDGEPKNWKFIKFPAKCSRYQGRQLTHQLVHPVTTSLLDFRMVTATNGAVRQRRMHYWIRPVVITEKFYTRDKKLEVELFGNVQKYEAL